MLVLVVMAACPAEARSGAEHQDASDAQIAENELYCLIHDPRTKRAAWLILGRQEAAELDEARVVLLAIELIVHRTGLPLPAPQRGQMARE